MQENIIAHKSLYKELFFYISGVVLLAVCSQIYIPLEPVPVTLQTAGVMIIGMLYNKQRAINSCMLYLTLGFAGAPIFASHASGLSIMSGASGGYLIGFIFAIYTINFMKEKFGSESFKQVFLNCLVATAVIFFFGILWLSKFVGFKAAISFGLVPFILPGIVKAAIVSASLRALRIIK